MDIVDKPRRSTMMASIRSKNTTPEMVVRKLLHTKGFRYRLHVRSLPGSPDIVLPKYRLAVFVHGCFWHQHQDCSYATTPDQNREKWQAKFAQNHERDARNIRELKSLGWRVLVVWECATKTREARERLSGIPTLIRDMEHGFLEWPASADEKHLHDGEASDVR